MPPPIQPVPGAGAVYRVDSRLEGNIRNSFRARQPLFTHNLNQEGVHLFQERTPGRVFHLGGGSYYHNTGTAADGSYVPGFTYQNGRLTYHRLLDYDPNARPRDPEAHSTRAIQQLDLVDNGNSTYSRRGFVGTYTVRSDGGIEFSGGHHQSNPNIRFERQVYYNGYWYRLPRASGGFAPGRSDAFSSSPQAAPATTPTTPVRPQPRRPVAGGNPTSPAQHDTHMVSTSLPQVTPRETAPVLPTGITSPKSPPGRSRIPVRFGSGMSANTLTSVDGNNLFTNVGGRWYEVGDTDQQYPYTLSGERRGRIHYLEPGEYGHSPNVVPPDDGSGHPTELQSLIQSVRRYYDQSRSYAASATGRRPGGRLPDRAGIPTGFRLMPGGNEFNHSRFPNYWFVSSYDSEGRPGMYYRHVDEAPTFWRSMATDGNRYFRQQGGRMVEVDSQGRQFAPGTTQQVGQAGNVLSTPPAAIVEDIPPRAGDAVGFSPTEGQVPHRTVRFTTDLVSLTFPVEIDLLTSNRTVTFKPQFATSRDWLENRVQAQQYLSGAGIRIVPRFGRQTHQGSMARGPFQTESLIGYNVEFYNPGNYQATIIQNYPMWYSLDSGRRDPSAYPRRTESITVEAR